MAMGFGNRNRIGGRSCWGIVLSGTLWLLLSPSAHAATVLDDILTDSATGATAVRNVTFSPTGALFDDPFDGIDYPDTLFPAQGTIELIFRTTESGIPSPRFVLDTRGADVRLAGDSVILIANGVVGDINNPAGASAGQVFFTVDPSGGSIPSTLPGVISSSVLNDGAFHCLAVSYGASGLAVYVDGALEDSAPAITAPLVRSTISLGDFVDGFATGMSFGGEIIHVRTSNTENDVQLPAIVGCTGELRRQTAPALSPMSMLLAAFILVGIAFRTISVRYRGVST